MKPEITGSPLLGEHTDEVLASLGYGTAEIAALTRRTPSNSGSARLRTRIASSGGVDPGQLVAAIGHTMSLQLVPAASCCGTRARSASSASLPQRRWAVRWTSSCPSACASAIRTATTRPWQRHHKYGADLLRVPAVDKSGRTLCLAFTVALIKDAGGMPEAIVAVIAMKPAVSGRTRLAQARRRTRSRHRARLGKRAAQRPRA